MTTTTTSNFQLQKIDDGTESDTWGARQREDQDRLDDILGGYLSISVAGPSDVTLTEAQYDHQSLEFTGTLTGNISVIFPAYQRMWRIYNNTSGSFSVTVKVNGQTGFEVTQGKRYIAQGNGTDLVEEMNNEFISVVEDTTPQLGGVLDTDGNAINESEGAAVASAGTTDIWATDGNTIHVTGTTTITSLSTAPRVGAIRRVIFDGALTLTNGANLILPGGANITTAAGDAATFYADTTTQIRCIDYTKADGEPVAPAREVGEVVDYAGTSAPSKWLLCYGQAISRTTYAALFAAISTTYGVGDGSTTFNIPDLRGRVVAGKDDMGGASANRLTDQSGGLNGDTLGDTGGAETHQLITGEMPAHTHTWGSGSANGAAGGGYSGEVTTGSTGSTTSSTGGDNPHNNVQPTIILNKIIYAGV